MKYGLIALLAGALVSVPVHAENYGGLALGAAEFCEGAVRIQWQTWRSMDSDVLFDDEFSANYLSVSLREHF